MNEELYNKVVRIINLDILTDSTSEYYKFYLFMLDIMSRLNYYSPNEYSTSTDGELGENIRMYGYSTDKQMFDYMISGKRLIVSDGKIDHKIANHSPKLARAIIGYAFKNYYNLEVNNVMFVNYVGDIKKK